MPMFEDALGITHGDDRPQQPLQNLPAQQPAKRESSPSKPRPIVPGPTALALSRKQSEESIRTDLCEGPVSDSPPSWPQTHSAYGYDYGNDSSLERNGFLAEHQTQPTTPLKGVASAAIYDRAELIERLKRGESPNWVPNRRLESILHREDSQSPPRSSRPPSSNTAATALLPAADITPEKEQSGSDRDTEAAQRCRDGSNIERPRSALHSGDFTQDTTPTKPKRGRFDALRGEAVSAAKDDEKAEKQNDAFGRLQSGSMPWIATSPPRQYNPFVFTPQSPPLPSLADKDAFRASISSLSSSISSSFVYKPPTSPLVQSESNNDDDDTSNDYSMVDSPLAGGLRPSTRRYTFASAAHSPLRYSPSAFDSPFPTLPLPQSRQHTASFRREHAFPYQAHQPRRSLTSTSSFSPQRSSIASTPQTPALGRPRRLSFASDTALQHASMVGSYEESILRGRMSTTPSKPLDFLAQIGVLGLGAQCKPSLRCPPHVTLPFSAVFYSYASTPHGRTKDEDGPSPYVGMIDLENGLTSQEAVQRSKWKRMQSRATSSGQTAEKPVEGTTVGGRAEDVGMEDAQEDGATLKVPPSTSAAARSQKRRPCNRAPPGGSYRIPAHGQLQIIIKNQNKTAVKLFLIPYDLTDMEPGTKTFIRQRSYSAGPIIDNVPALSNLSLSERPILRYLVHLHICCPSRGRHYLYKSIRVVFANRVPDGKEKLRNEVTYPEPRYSPYKPIRAMHPPIGANAAGSGGGGVGAMLVAEKAYRRRSLGLSFASHGDELSRPSTPPPLPLPIPMPKPTAQRLAHQTPSPSFSFAANLSAGPAPFGLAASSVMGGRPSSSITEIGGPAWSAAERTEDGRDVSAPITYNKLSKGDVGYGGNAYVSMVNGSPVAAEGLLSQRLRSLEVEKAESAEGHAHGEASS